MSNVTYFESATKNENSFTSYDPAQSHIYSVYHSPAYPVAPSYVAESSTGDYPHPFYDIKPSPAFNAEVYQPEFFTETPQNHGISSYADYNHFGTFNSFCQN